MLQFKIRPVKRKVIALGPYDIFKGIGVSVSWHETHDDEEGELVPYTVTDNEVLYKTYTDTYIKVSVCVPPNGEKTRITTVFIPPTGAQLEETKKLELEPSQPHTFPAFQLSAGKRSSVLIKDEHNNELVRLTIEVKPE